MALFCLTCCILLICSLTHEHWVTFMFLFSFPRENKAILNVGTQISRRNLAFNYFDCLPRSGITGSDSNLVIYNFLRTCHSVSMMAMSPFTPTNSAQEFWFFQIFVNSGFLLCFFIAAMLMGTGKYPYRPVLYFSGD